jgi:hypothetical protein
MVNTTVAATTTGAVAAQQTRARASRRKPTFVEQSSDPWWTKPVLDCAAALEAGNVLLVILVHAIFMIVITMAPWAAPTFYGPKAKTSMRL